ncbi:hypothetical protein [Sphaerisporangium dianthi]|uniref:FtsK domain-containing protein n=1 Tax=Sphaerisporangium dianthi TaxID=1436120 RepID=A0ABV9CRI0_9ACTN
MTQIAEGHEGTLLPFPERVPELPGYVPDPVPEGEGFRVRLARFAQGVKHRRHLLKYAVKATYLTVSAPVVGTARLAGTGWRWIRADDYGSARGDSPAFVEAVRTRRRRQAWMIAGPYLGVTAGAWLLWDGAAPVLSLSLVLGTGTAVEVKRRLADRTTPLRFPGLGKKTPADNAVVRAAISAKLATGSVEEMRLASPVITEASGWSTVLQLPPGQRARKAIGKEADFASALGVGETQVVFDLLPEHAGRLAVYVAKADPFLKIYPSPLIGRTDPMDFWAGIPAGVNGRGKPETLRLVDASLLVAGEPRAGKSAAVNGIIGCAALAVTPRIHLWDGKGAGDHRPWRKIAHTAEKRNASGLLAHLKRMQAQMERVFDMLDEAGGSAKLTPALCRQLGVDIELTVVDETRYYVTSPQGEEIVDAMVDIASRGPAAGVLLVLASQRMTTDAIPGPLKGVCSLRWAMRCPDSTASNAVLGQGAVGRGFDASEIPRRTHRGVGILDADGSEPVKLRSYFLDDSGPDLTDIAEAAYVLRQAAGTLPAGPAPVDQVDDAPVRDVLAAMGEAERMHTAELVARLAERQPSMGWDASKLAAVLRPYGVTPGDLKVGGINKNGYRREDLLAALGGF